MAFIAAHAWFGLRAFFLPAQPRAVSYCQNNLFGVLGVVLAIGAVPEIPLHHVFLPLHDWWLAAILDMLLLYSAAWVLGAYGIMVKRPHEIGDDRIVLHNGPFARACIDPRDVVIVTSMEAVNRRSLRKAHPAAAHLLVPGAGCVRIALSRPALIERMYPLRAERSALEIFVSSDRPRDLCALLGG